MQRYSSRLIEWYSFYEKYFIAYLCIMKNEWFASWFDSHYYHLLYKHRNDAEAKLFIDNLVAHLQLKPGNTVADIACGKGRHALLLANHGLLTLGVDLSPNSIEHAQQYSNQNLEFAVHDMRKTLRINYFDAVFNMFTSFGYFKTEADNVLAAKSLSASVKPGGFLVIDFLNVPSATKNVLANSYEEKTEEQILFKISRELIDKQFCKTIEIHENNNLVQTHTERVNALELSDFEKYFLPNNMQLVQTFGNYKLEPLQVESPRLIMIFKKNIISY